MPILPTGVVKGDVLQVSTRADSATGVVEGDVLQESTHADSAYCGGHRVVVYKWTTHTL